MGCIGSILKNRNQMVTDNQESNIPFIHYEIYDNYLKNFQIQKRFEFNEYVYKIMENNRLYILKIHYKKKSFKREYQILKKIKKITKTIDVYKVIQFSERDIFQGGLIIYDYIPGNDLYNYFNNNRNMSSKEIKKIFKKIVDILKNIHSYDIFHGDIKLENIVCKYNNHEDLYLIDFGLSRECKKDEYNKINKCFGTIPFVAPELFSNRFCLKSDIWSLGCILYILVFKCLPFTNIKSRYSYLIINIDNYLVKLKESISNDIDKSLVELIFKMLEPDVKKRYSITDVANHRWLLN